MVMSITKNEIKTIKSLYSKKFRDETGNFIVEGEKLVSEAVNSNFVIEKIYRKDEIGDEQMARISHLTTPSPVLAIVRKPKPQNEEDIIKIIGNKGLFLLLDTIRDPGNLGTIIRIADWFGIKAIFVSEDTVDRFNPKTVQATMGAIFRVDFHYCDLKFIANAIITAGGKVYGTFLDGENLYTKPLATGKDCPVAIVIGNEANGISTEIASIVNERLLIPTFATGTAGSESLNAAVAAGITIAEFRRRLG